jgi:hypothetical protein
MGTLQFLLPPDYSATALAELKRACITGGQDNMPFLTELTLAPSLLGLHREENESGCAAMPWAVADAGMLMTSTATLIERNTPYPATLELARGKVNQLRNQAANWLADGLNAPAALPGEIHDATSNFVRAIALSPRPEATVHAQNAMTLAFKAAEHLVNAYVEQVFQIRHQRQARLDTALSCRLDSITTAEPLTAVLKDTFNTICLPLTWGAVESTQNAYQWAPYDKLLDWATGNGFAVGGGPLIDFEPSQMPAWLLQREPSLAAVVGQACRYAETVVRRYRGRIRTWQLAAAANRCTLPGIGEEEILWLLLRVAEAVRQVDPGLELIISLAQPWGEYLATQSRSYSPFVFADQLVRNGLNLAGLHLELVMGVAPRGSYCRDLLECSRLLELYGHLCLPLHITLGLPSSDSSDKLAGLGKPVQAGTWRGGCSPEIQAQWAGAFGALALCKPGVQSVQWVHLSDAEPHLFPHCGLVDALGKPKPVMMRLRQLRESHLR